MAYSLDEINHMTRTEFVAVFGSVFEDTPSIAVQSWQQQPFLDVNHLHQTMVQMVEQMSETAKLDLIRAHPDLGSRAKMAPASVQEQASIGLDNLNMAEYSQFKTLNKCYQTKFGFPLIMAVKDQTKEIILAAFTTRLQNTPAVEQQQALIEINKIARYRLDDLID